MEKRSLIIALLALGIGISGVGLGAYATVVRGPPGPPGEDGTDGEDGIDAPGFYCFSEIDIQNAIATIGIGSGIINIMEDIVLSAAIDVNSGGNYIIQGNGLITIESPISDYTFDITFARSCILRDLVIDASRFTLDMSIIRIEEVGNNPIFIDNVRIFGGNLPFTSSGIYVSSENVRVSNCQFKNMSDGIYTDSDYSMIYDNIITRSASGITLFNCCKGVIKNNYVEKVGTGITCANSNYTVISYNIIKEFSGQGIFLLSGFPFVMPKPGGFYHFTFFNEIVGNHISTVMVPSVRYNRSCICIQDSEENKVIGNYCFECINDNPSYHGMGITLIDGDNNYIASNTFLMNNFNIYVDSDSTGNIFIGNIE